VWNALPKIIEHNDRRNEERNKINLQLKTKEANTQFLYERIQKIEKNSPK
jgi:hypothetical protein